MTKILQKLPCHLHDINTIVTSPHKVYGASTNDMILQVRQHRIEKISLAGLVGNLCVEALMRDFIEHGFEVAMVRDATAGTSNEEGDGYRAALFSPRSAVSQPPWVIAIVSRVEACGSACHRIHFMEPRRG